MKQDKKRSEWLPGAQEEPNVLFSKNKSFTARECQSLQGIEEKTGPGGSWAYNVDRTKMQSMNQCKI